MGTLGHGQQFGSLHCAQTFGQGLGREFGLGHTPSRTGLHQKSGIGGLVVVHRVRERHKQGRRTHRRNFSDGARASAAHHDIGLSKRCGGVLNEGGQLGLYAGLRVIGTQCLDLFFATLVQHLRPLGLGQQGQRLRNGVVQRLGAQAAPNDQQAQRARAARQPFGRAGLLQKRSPQRVANPFALGQRIGKSGVNAVSHTGKHLIGHAGHRVLLVQHQGFAGQHAHHAARKGDVAAQAHQHIGLDAAHHLQGLPKGAQQTQRQQSQRCQAFAPNAAKVDGVQLKTTGWHQTAFHAVWRTQPMHLPATLAQCFGHGQTGEDVSTGTTGHDECGLGHHMAPLRIMARFS